MKDEGLREKVIKGLECCILRDPDDHARCSQCQYESNCVNRLKMDALELLKEQEPRVLTLDEAAAAQEVWVEAWLSVPKKYVIMVTSLYLTDDCKNFELELLGTDKKAFMLAEAYGHTWRCWSAKPTDDQRKAVKWG